METSQSSSSSLSALPTTSRDSLLNNTFGFGDDISNSATGSTPRISVGGSGGGSAKPPRKSYLSEMVNSFIPGDDEVEHENINATITNPKSRQRGIHTIVFNTLAILLSVSILFLLVQVYYIFLPCLKALLWALLCGSALYPFKASLNASLQSWLDNLEQKNQTFIGGLLLLPAQCLYGAYCLLIEYLSRNKVLVILFHFRFQLCQLLSFFGSLTLTIITHNKGIITAFVILCTTAQIILTVFKNSNSSISIQTLSSFNFLPSICLLIFFYTLHCIGLIGHVLFTLFTVISLTGFGIKLYNLAHNPNFESVVRNELSVRANFIGERLNDTFQQVIHWLLGKLHPPGDVPDGDRRTHMSKHCISLLVTIYLMVLAEQFQLSNGIISLFCIHMFTIKVFKLIFDNFSSAKKFFTELKISIGERLEKDFLFSLWVQSFCKGDQVIRKSLQQSADLLTSIGLILAGTLLIGFFSVFLSIKVYGECYFSLNLLRNELTKIEYIKESINLTLNDVTNVDYLNSFVQDTVLSTSKWNLKEEDRAMMNKMFMNLQQNILVFLNTSLDSNGATLVKSNETIATVGEQNQTAILSNFNSADVAQLIADGNIFALIKSLWSRFSLMDLKKLNFEVAINFVTSRANSYLPLFKGFLSILYAFIFVILDSGSMVLGFLLNLLIFTLALFYLLSTSRDKYKPIEILDSIVSALFTSSHEQNSRLSRYVEEICCIPSVIAAILAAVPLLNAYWASLPACIYLYYFDPTMPLLKSLSMLAMAIMPSFIVDSSIYSDIKRAGHPYLTGLAITCGVVYYGVEGALFGPLWLCFLFIIIHMCTNLTSDNQANDSIIVSPTGPR